MHIPIGPAAKILRATFNWYRSVLGLGYSKYPKYLRNSEIQFTDDFLNELCQFLNAAFETGYKPYDVERLRSWLNKSPDLFLCVIDRVVLSKIPFTPQIVGAYKLIPLSPAATKLAMNGDYEVIDIKPEEIEVDIAKCSGIWIGDLSVLSPFQSIQSGVLGRHLMELIKASLRNRIGKVPIFCRSERKDIQDLLLRTGFIPILKGEITGKTVWMLPTYKQENSLKRLPLAKKLRALN